MVSSNRRSNGCIEFLTISLWRKSKAWKAGTSPEAAELSALLPLHRLPADVAAAEPARPADPVHRPIGPRLRLASRSSPIAETLSTRPPFASTWPSLACVPAWKISHALDRGRLVEPLDHRALPVGARITVRRHHHRQRGVRIPAQVEILELAVAATRSAPASRSDISRSISTCVSGSPNRALYSISFGPCAGDHQPGEQHALVGRAHRLHGAHGRRDDLVHGARGSSPASSPAPANTRPCRRCSARCRRRRPACGPAPRPAGSRSRRRTARRTRPPRRSGTPRPRPRRRQSPSPPSNIMSTAASASSSVMRDHHALAGGQPVRLDHDRRADPAHVVLGGFRGVEALVGRGRNVVGLAEVLGEALGALEPRRQPGSDRTS